MSWGKTASNWVNAMAGCFFFSFFFSLFIFVLWRERVCFTGSNDYLIYKQLINSLQVGTC